jgi:hypothetical protein
MEAVVRGSGFRNILATQAGMPAAPGGESLLLAAECSMRGSPGMVK